MVAEECGVYRIPIVRSFGKKSRLAQDLDLDASGFVILRSECSREFLLAC